MGVSLLCEIDGGRWALSLSSITERMFYGYRIPVGDASLAIRFSCSRGDATHGLDATADPFRFQEGKKLNEGSPAKPRLSLRVDWH